MKDSELFIIEIPASSYYAMPIHAGSYGIPHYFSLTLGSVKA
jgi:hypothetical protein